MSQQIRDFVTPSCALLALGEPTHQEPAFALLRNELFAQLVEQGFRSIALESDRVAALTADDFVRDGTGGLDHAMSEGFSHGLGELATNRQLLAWMREYNRNQPPEQRLTFYGFDLRPTSERLLRTLRGIGGELARFLASRRPELGDRQLTDRELDVLRLAAEGKPGPQIAEDLFLSPLTVKTHFQHIYEKLGVGDRAGAVARAIRTGLIR